MDDIDRAILGELVHNGRASHRRLGAVAGLSANAAAERMRRLVRSGRHRRASPPSSTTPPRAAA